MVSSSSKRARASNSGVWCLVERCGVDLSGSRGYHRRHKVCEVHSKTPVVVVGGQEQRFCQQCSRFHLLAEFDDVKRSCRKRLDGHNRRRRKPQPEYINMFSNHQGTMFSSYYQIPSSSISEPSRIAIAKAEEDAIYSHHPTMHHIDSHQYFSNSFHNYKEGKQFSFPHDVDKTLPLPKTITTSDSGSNRMFSNRLTPILDSDRVLSLLSSPTQTSSIDLGQLPQSRRVPMSQPPDSSLQYIGLGPNSHSQASNNVSRTGFSYSEIEDERVDTVLVSDASRADMGCPDLFQVASEVSVPCPARLVSFAWQSRFL